MGCASADCRPLRAIRGAGTPAALCSFVFAEEVEPMLTIRGAWLRFYPTFLTLLMLAQRALALEGLDLDEDQKPIASRQSAGGEPLFDVVADEFAIPGVRFHLEVDPQTPVRALYAYLPGAGKRRARLAFDKETGRYRGDLTIPEHITADELTIRIVARGRARSPLEQDRRVPVLSDLDSCDDEETCGLIPLPPEGPDREPAIVQ
jgi:hypothetical protein